MPVNEKQRLRKNGALIEVKKKAQPEHFKQKRVRGRKPDIN